MVPAQPRRGFAAAGIVLILSGCGGSGAPTAPAPGTPSTPTPPPTPGSSITARVVSSFAPTQGIGGVTVVNEQLGETTTNADGYFTLQAIAPLAYAIRVNGTSWVERQTYLRVPGAETSVSLIPQALNMTYFDEMCRAFGRLLRWGSAPVLVVETAVLQYGSRVASEDTVPADVVERTMNDVRSGLALQSAGRFPDFASIEIRRTTAGAASTVPSGAVGLTWQRGLGTGFGHVAYGARAPGAADGGLIRGEVALDFDWHVHGLPAGSRRDSFNVIHHELGHTLGYSHTKVAPSFMYEVFLMTVSAQDRQAFEVFMQRPSGNQTPDIDPAEAPLNFNAVTEEMQIPRCAFLAR
jgi:hypothetical protein